MVEAPKGANPGVQYARREWKGCFVAYASNGRARRLNLPLRFASVSRLRQQI